MIQLKNTVGCRIVSGEENDALRITNKELARRRRPNKTQIARVKSYLRQFGIKTDVPQFDSVGEMEIWKLAQVKKGLNTY